MEKLVHETFEALQAQTDALSRGTNPIVYFPVGTQRIPELPVNAISSVVDSKGEGAGTYFFNPRYVRREEIVNAIATRTLWLLLGFVQSKQDAMAGGLPAVVVARSDKGQEIKTAVVDARNSRAIVLQKMVFERQFPDASVSMEMPQAVLLERMFSAQGATH